MAFKFRYTGRSSPPPAPRWESSTEGTGETTMTITLTPNAELAIPVQLSRVFAGQSFVPIAVITSYSEAFDLVSIKGIRVTGDSSVDVIILASSNVLNKSITVKAVGIAC